LIVYIKQSILEKQINNELDLPNLDMENIELVAF